MPDVSVLDVRLYDEPIGTLTHLQGDRSIFAFNEDYVENPGRPTLSLSFKDDLSGLITNIRPTQRVVPPFFSNLLPEGGLRRYLAERAGVSIGSLYQSNTIRNGRVVERNFQDFVLPEISEMPKVETVLVPTGGFWGGHGEPGILSFAPAVLNAVAQATGKRVRTLPIKPGDLKKA